MDARGDLLFEYTPLPMSPMTVAELLLLGIVTLAAPLALPPDLFPLGGLCFLPLVGVAVWAIIQWPSRTRIFAQGIEVSLPVWRRIVHAPTYLPWAEVTNVYPASYEIAGAAMSPFASSAGTLVHTGLGLETNRGRRFTVKFTPGSIRQFRAESSGFTYAMEAVRVALRDLGRPLVTDARTYTNDEVLRMHEEARRPLLGLDAIVYAFFLPPTIVAISLAAFLFLGITPDAPLLIAVVAAAVVPPIASMSFTLQKSRRRNWLLGELSKQEEAARVRG